MGPFEILCGVGVVILALYYYFTMTFDFWKSRGVPGPEPTPPFGNIKDVLFSRKSMTDYLTDLYHHYKNEPMVGIFARRTPILIVKDPDVIKDVLIKDFSHFADRGIPTHKKVQVLSHVLRLILTYIQVCVYNNETPSEIFFPYFSIILFFASSSFLNICTIMKIC